MWKAIIRGFTTEIKIVRVSLFLFFYYFKNNLDKNIVKKY